MRGVNEHNNPVSKQLLEIFSSFFDFGHFPPLKIVLSWKNMIMIPMPPID